MVMVLLVCEDLAGEFLVAADVFIESSWVIWFTGCRVKFILPLISFHFQKFFPH